MIRFSIGETLFSLEFGFFAMLLFVTLTQGEAFLLRFFLACFLHELAHLFAMGCCHKPVRLIRFHGTGILIQPLDTYGSYLQDCWISLAGPLANLVLALALWWGQFPEAAALQFCLGAFNLLPYACLDGGQLLQNLLLGCHVSLERVRWICRVTSLSCTLLLALLCLRFRIWNPWLLVGMVTVLWESESRLFGIFSL